VPAITHVRGASLMKSRPRPRWSAHAALLVALCLPLVASAGALALPVREHVAPKAGETVGQSTSPRGDTPFEHPGASRARELQPPATIEVVRPERTIVRESDATWPTVLAASALLIALAGAGYTLARIRSLQRGVGARSHRRQVSIHGGVQ
jgi:hypothetical protein